MRGERGYCDIIGRIDEGAASSPMSRMTHDFGSGRHQGYAMQEGMGIGHAAATTAADLFETVSIYFYFQRTPRVLQYYRTVNYFCLRCYRAASTRCYASASEGHGRCRAEDYSMTLAGSR